MERVKHNLKNVGNSLFCGVFLILISIVLFFAESLKQIIILGIMVLGILLVLRSILKPNNQDKKGSGVPNNCVSEIIGNYEINDFLKAKNFFISYYQNIASAQAVRLIGFTAGIFTLIGAVQIIPEKHLKNLVPDTGIFIILDEILSPISSSIIVFLLSVLIFILSFFVVRAVFRYATYANLADTFIHISKKETIKAKGETLHAQIISALESRIEKYPRKVFGMSLLYFFSFEGNSKTNRGLFVCICTSILATFVLLLLIW